MSAILLDGRALAEEINFETRHEIESLGTPSLAVVLVGDDPASMVYVSNKRRTCERLGIRSEVYKLPGDIPESELLGLIDKLNQQANINGILVQLPLPPHIHDSRVLLRINPLKDVDAFHPYNVGMLLVGKPAFKPCTPAGIIELIKRSGISIAGKSCVVVGRSNIVGKPTAALLIAENGTVTVCHSHTVGLADICRDADILVVAIGRPRFITADMIKDNSVVIDVGIHHMENGRLCGDVDFDTCKDKAGYITPVPGGVGPMTIAMLMRNCLAAYKSNL